MSHLLTPISLTTTIYILETAQQNGKKADQAHRSLTLEEYLEASFKRDSEETIRFGDGENQTENTEIEFTLDTNTGQVDYTLTIEGEELSETYQEQESIQPGNITVNLDYQRLLNDIDPGEYTLKLTAQTQNGESNQTDTIPIKIDQQGINLQENVQRRELGWKLMQNTNLRSPFVIDSVASSKKGGEEYLNAWNDFFEEVTGVRFAEDIKSFNAYNTTTSGDQHIRHTYVVDGDREWQRNLSSKNDKLFEVDIGGKSVSVYEFNTLGRLGFYLNGENVGAADLDPSMGVIGWVRDTEAGVRDMIEYISDGGDSAYDSLSWPESEPAQNSRIFQSAHNSYYGLFGGGYTTQGQIMNDTEGDGVGTLELDEEGRLFEKIYDSDNNWSDPEEYSRPEDTIEDMHPSGYGED